MNDHTIGVPQAGIFAFGSSSHAYLEFDAVDVTDADSLVSIVAGSANALTAGRALNVVVGFRPELWLQAEPAGLSAPLEGFNKPVVGPDGFTMPATQHDVVVWLSGGANDLVFDASVQLIDDLAAHLSLASHVQGWHYHENHDLTGFVDGTENPSPTEAPGLVLIPSGPAAGGCVLLLQQWLHDSQWRHLSQAKQEAAIGRTRDTDEELDNRPDTSHVARTDQEDFGRILRRNTAFGTAERHGTMFVGFSATRQVLADMLNSMAGIGHPRDELTRYTTPLSGSYYFVPALTSLARRLPPED